MREVEIKALLVDPYQNTPVVLLKDQSSDKVVPIWIGTPEATAIAIALQQREFPRPLTHDLLQSVLETLGGELDMVVIDHIEDSTYFATLVVRDREGEVHEIDARPSDSIALALRTGSPIYVAEEVFAQSAIDLPYEENEGENQDDDRKQREQFKLFVEKEMNLAEFKKFIQ